MANTNDLGATCLEACHATTAYAQMLEMARESAGGPVHQYVAVCVESPEDPIVMIRGASRVSVLLAYFEHLAITLNINMFRSFDPTDADIIDCWFTRDRYASTWIIKLPEDDEVIQADTQKSA